MKAGEVSGGGGTRGREGWERKAMGSKERELKAKILLRQKPLCVPPRLPYSHFIISDIRRRQPNMHSGSDRWSTAAGIPGVTSER